MDKVPATLNDVNDFFWGGNSNFFHFKQDYLPRFSKQFWKENIANANLEIFSFPTISQL